MVTLHWNWMVNITGICRNQHIIKDSLFNLNKIESLFYVLLQTTNVNQSTGPKIP